MVAPAAAWIVALAATLASLTLPATLAAQPVDAAGPIAADRPGFGTAPAILAGGVLQVELGAFLLRATGRHEAAAPQLLWRVGIGHGIELRLDSELFVRAHVPGAAVVRGRSDVTAAAKIALWDGLGQRLQTAVLPALSVPAGTGEFSSGSVDPDVAVLWTAILDGGWSVGGIAQVGSRHDDRGRAATTAYSAALSRSWHDRLSVYVEGHRVLDDATPRWTLEAGTARVLAADVAADISAGRLLTPTGGWFAAAGLSLRRVPRGRR